MAGLFRSTIDLFLPNCYAGVFAMLIGKHLQATEEPLSFSTSNITISFLSCFNVNVDISHTV